MGRRGECLQIKKKKRQQTKTWPNCSLIILSWLLFPEVNNTGQRRTLVFFQSAHMGFPLQPYWTMLLSITNNLGQSHFSLNLREWSLNLNVFCLCPCKTHFENWCTSLYIQNTQTLYKSKYFFRSRSLEGVICYVYMFKINSLKPWCYRLSSFNMENICHISLLSNL